MKKGILGLILTLAMVLSCMPIIAYAQTSGECGENLTWTLDDDGTLAISGTGDMTDFERHSDIPWENEKKSITKIVIEDGVTSIGKLAFEYCDNLERVTIPQSVNKIGDDAIYSCDNLLSIEVDENNEAYMSDDGILFNKAKTLIVCYPAKKENTSYEIPDSVTCIEWGAFSECKNLESIHIPDSVKEVGGFAFEECSNLTSLTIPDGVTKINYGMAAECEKLASIKFPDSINSIAYYVIDGTAYYNDPSNWKDDVLFVDKCLMEAHKDAQLGNYQIPDGTLTIADEAFYTCEGLTGVSIPESVTSIGTYAFKDTAYYNDDANWTDNALYIDNCLIDTKTALSGDYQIQDGTRLIAAGAFYNAKNITSITIPKSVTRIGYEAFHICDREIDLIFKAPNAANLYTNIYIDGDTFLDNLNKIYIHEGYTGYTEENGYPADKIVVEPHDFADGVCSICGERETVLPIERIDESGDAKYAFRVNLGQEYENCYVYAAVYDAEGVLVSINRVQLEMTGDTVISLDKSENDMTAKVFVWTDELQPILEIAEEFPLNN